MGKEIRTYKYHPLSENKLDKPYEVKSSEVDLEGKSIAIFTIGPVQSFISAAKKTREFWAGSYLLSYLIWQAVELVISRVGEENIIFPFIKDQPFYYRFIEEETPSEIKGLEMPTLPNRFLAILKQDRAAEILKSCEEKVKNELLNIWREEIPYLDIKGEEQKEKLTEQIEKLLQVYWVALPLEDDLEKELKRYQEFKNLEEEDFDSQYALATSFAEELLVSRKNLREFEPVEEEGIKCFICGERSAFIEPEYEDKLICGVCALKRNFHRYYSKHISNEALYYPSIIEITTWNYKQELTSKLSSEEQEDLIRAFAEEFDQLRRTPQLLVDKEYSSQERELLEINGAYFDLEGEKIKDNPRIKKLLSQFNDTYDLKLNKYYGLIYMDGDGMGNWVSGEYLNKPMSPMLHSLVSRALTNYSLKFVKQIVEEEYCGKVIYAGGDDVVALVNLEDLFNIMQKLRAYFSGSLIDGKVDLTGKIGIIEGDLTLGYKASVSLGACIAHYKEPLNLVINKAQEMETKAKNNIVNGRQKDAFALGLLKHSGGIRETSAKWLYEEIDIIEEGIKPLLKVIRNENLSKGYIYNLKEELDQLSGSGTELKEVIEVEMKRIAARKSEAININQLNSIIDNLRLVYENKYSTADTEKSINNLENFISLLEIIFFIGKRGE